MRTIIVSASNDNFLPLAKGLWLSLRDTGLNLGYVDIGDSEATRHWLSSEAPGVRVATVTAGVAERLGRLQHLHYSRAQIVRPFLPEMFPGYDCIVWIDSDVWVQDATVFDTIDQAVAAAPQAVTLAAVHDVSYRPLYDNARAIIEGHVTPVFGGFYGAAVAADFCYRPLLSSGLFAMRVDSDLWGLWADEVERLFTRGRDIGANLLHVAEQTALTYVAYTSGRFVALEALDNYHAHLGALERGGDGRVVTAGPLRRLPRVVHLSDIVNHGQAGAYLDAGLLFDQGRYLSASEAQHVRALSRS